MADEKEQPASFKVVDRRAFTADGTRLAGEREPAEKEEPKLQPEARHESSAARAREPELARPAPESLPEFETLVSYLSTTAMFQLGLLAGPSGEAVSPDLPNASRTIELLEVLQKKTRGNLTEDEGRLLDDVLYEVRMSYVEIEKRLAPKRR